LKIEGEEYQLETLNDITETEVSDDENQHEEEAVEFEEDDKSTSDMGGKKDNVLILKAENEDLKNDKKRLEKKIEALTKNMKEKNPDETPSDGFSLQEKEELEAQVAHLSKKLEKRDKKLEKFIQYKEKYNELTEKYSKYDTEIEQRVIEQDKEKSSGNDQKSLELEKKNCNF